MQARLGWVALVVAGMMSAAPRTLFAFFGGQPESCAEVRALNPSAPDGDYLISPAGFQFQVYCFDMAGTPREYLTLVHTGSSSNFAQYFADPTDYVVTHYTRIRLDPATLLIDISDQTFASSTLTGHVGNGPITVTSMPYGVAMACQGCGLAGGGANVDVRGLPFKVANTWVLGGACASGTTTLSANDQVVDVTGGGYCGWNSPAPLYNPFNTTGGFDVQLIPMPPLVAPAPALSPTLMALTVAALVALGLLRLRRQVG